MGGDVLSGGVVVALAAALWLAYLLPSWLRRRQYLATERNAVRLQQTLRILAETAEVPQQVRVEATAREVAVQQRLLKKAEERVLAEATARAKAEAERRSAELAAAVAAEAEAEALIAKASVRAARAVAESKAVAANAALTDAAVISTPLTPSVSAILDASQVARARRRRVRKARAATSLALLAGLTFLGYGVVQVIAASSFVFLAGGLGLALAAICVQARLARVGRMGPLVASVVLPAPGVELYDDADHHEVPVEVEPATWTPQPLPKPLYLSRGTIAASAMASVDAAKELRRAAAREDVEKRARELVAPVTRLRPVASSPAPDGTNASVLAAVPTRFAGMGVVETEASENLDLDAVLRRRRAAS